jgi:predicted site-specific integrase-resolvase
MQLLNAREVAEILQVSTQPVYELSRQGILPNVRIWSAADSFRRNAIAAMDRKRRRARYD